MKLILCSICRHDVDDDEKKIVGYCTPLFGPAKEHVSYY